MIPRRLSLLTKVSLSLAAVGLIPLAVTPYLLNVGRDAMTEQVLRTHALAARSTASQVAAFLEGLRRPAEALARNPMLRSAPRSPASQSLLSGALSAQPALAAVVVAAPGGEEVIRVQRRGQAEVVTTLLARPAAELLAERAGPTLWLRLDLPLLDGPEQLRLVADATSLVDLVDPEELGEDAALALVGPEDQLIASSDPATGLEAFPAAMLDEARARLVSGAGRHAGGEGDGEVLGAHAPVPGSDWFVVSRQPAAVAEAVALRMRRRSLIAVAIALSLTALLSAAAYRSLVRPLRELVQSQRRLARAAGAPASQDEIEQLRSTLALLEREEADRTALGDVFLGRYQVIEPIGSGGMASVFRGWDPKLERAVALKTLRLSAALRTDSQVEHVSTLLREAVMVARMNHPNIVAVYDLEDLGEAAFIAMEFVDGGSLQRYISGGRRLSPSDAVPIAEAIARGLAAAHGGGVVHRDIKPANVLLGRDGAIKVTDFGIAEVVSSRAKRADVVFGTPGYLPPEALAGEGQGPSADLFATGVVLYEMLSGRYAFPGRDIAEIGRRTILEAVEPLPPGLVPDELARLVDSLLRKDPSRRPDDAAAVADQLGSLAAQHGWRWKPFFPDKPVVGQDELRISHLIATHAVRGAPERGDGAS